MQNEEPTTMTTTATTATTTTVIPLPTEPKLPKVRKGWECPSCTFFNAVGRTCGACSRPKDIV
jgi:hypothetical protein